MKNIDDILKQALTPTEKPDFWVNQNILSKAKGAHQMKQKKLKTMAAAALSAALILGIGSLTIYAARKFLLPEHIAEEIKDPKLAAAFKSKDAVSINETQSYGGYDVTLMGMVSGKSISEFLVSDGNEVHDDRTYAVMAIEKSDMSPMPSTSDDSYSAFFASPLIEGLNPAFYNAFTFQWRRMASSTTSWTVTTLSILPTAASTSASWKDPFTTAKPTHLTRRQAILQEMRILTG